MSSVHLRGGTECQMRTFCRWESVGAKFHAITKHELFSFEEYGMPMYRTHSASLVRNAASTPFARDLRSPRNTDPRAEFSVDYSKELKGFYRDYAKGMLGGEDTSTPSVFVYVVLFSTVSRPIALTTQIADGGTRARIYALDSSPLPLQPPGLCALSTPPPVATWSFPAFSLHWIRSGTCQRLSELGRIHRTLL
jgi:hypothetical protein